MSSLPAGFAETLPGRYYVDPGVHQLERERIFASMWTCAGRADDLPRPGSFVCTTVAGESILLTRDGDDTLRAFYNVCRHRGARLCDEPRGERASVRCPYHAWTYGLDGRLLGAPMMPELTAHAFDLELAALVAVELECWGGMIWLRLGGGTGSAADQLDREVAARLGDGSLLDRYRLDRLRTGRTIEYQVAANWKLVVENFMECSHCAAMHPELCRVVPGFRDGVGSFPSGSRGIELAPDVEAFSLSGRRSRPRLAGLREEDARRVHGVVLLPNVLMLLVPDHVVLLVLSPETATRTRVRCDWLFDPDEAARLDFDPTDAVALFDAVNRQDWRVLELTQEAMGSRSWSGGFFAPSERHVRAFDDFVLTRLAGASRGEGP